MPAAFTFPPLPPPPPKAAPVESFNSPASSFTPNSHNDGTQYSSRAHNHGTGGGRGQNHRGSRGARYGARGGRGTATNQHGRPDGNRNSHDKQTAIQSSEHRSIPNQSSTGIIANDQNATNVNGSQTLPPEMQQQYAAYTTAAQMMWNSPEFQTKLNQAQAHLSNARPASSPQHSANTYNQESHPGVAAQDRNASAPRTERMYNSSGPRDSRKDHQSPRGRGRGTSNKPQVRQRVAVAPSVPSFGFSLPTPVSPASRPSEHSKDSRSNKKRKTTHLGLINEEEPQYSSEEEEIDEEAHYAGSIDTIRIEYGDRTVKLSNAAEIAAWRAERRREFPTQARVQQKKQEAAELRDKLLQLQRGCEPSSRTERIESRSKEYPKAAPAPARDNDTQTRDRNEDLNTPRRRAQESTDNRKPPVAATATTSSNPLRRQDTNPTISLNLNYASDSDSDDQADQANSDHETNINASLSDTSSIISSSSALSPSDPDSSDSNSDSDSSSSSAHPETLSSKLPPNPLFIPPPHHHHPPPHNAPTKTTHPKLCPSLRKSNRHCKFGPRCRFRHQQTAEEQEQQQERRRRRRHGAGNDNDENSRKHKRKQRITLRDRWAAQEVAEANKLALEAIKYLGKKGFLT